MAVAIVSPSNGTVGTVGTCAKMDEFEPCEPEQFLQDSDGKRSSAADAPDSPLPDCNPNGSEEYLHRSSNGSHASDSERSPDPFDDSSPTNNVSRYGRARKQKLIADFYLPGSGVASTTNGKGEKTPSKLSPESVKSGDGRRKNPDRRSSKRNSNGVRGSSEETVESVDGSPKKNHGKVYIKKDLIQRKEDKEETVDLLRNMFSPAKAESVASSTGSDALSESPQSKALDIIVLKKSPEGIFKCSKKANSIPTVLKFEDEEEEEDDDHDREEIYENCNLNNGFDMLESQPIVLTDDEKSCNWEIGELAWARVGAHPMWPCLITRDPCSRVFARKKMVGRSIIPSFALHVTFFGDNGRHCWLLVNFLMRFTGLDDFNKIKINISPEMRKKDPKYCASFEVKENKKGKWLAAVSEAEMLLRRPPELREELAIMFFSPANNINKPLKKTKKLKMPNEKQENLQNVSLSESLFDSLFDTDNKTGESEDKKSPKIAKENGIIHPTSKKVIKKRKLKNQSSIDGWILKLKDTNNLSNNDGEKSIDQSIEDISATDIDVNLVPSENTNDKKISLNTGDNFYTCEEKKRTISFKLKRTGKRMSVQEQDNDEQANNTISIKKRRMLEEKTELQDSTVPDISANTLDATETPMECDGEMGTNTDSSVNVNSRTKKTDSKYEDPQFQTWLGSNGDFHRDMNPDLDDQGFLSYVYQIWQYNDDSVLDEMKNRSSVNQIKGMAEDVAPSPPKRTRRLVSNDISNSPIGNREKSARKSASNAYFYEGSSDSNDSDKEQNSANKIRSKDNVQVDIANNEVIDYSDNVVDVYMESLKVSKPNIYKGLSKEKVCEICESPGNLVKCKGLCQGMFHISCCEKQHETKVVTEDKTAVKAKKKRGRPKVKRNDSIESEGNSENSENVNASQDSNICNESQEELKNQSNKVEDEQSKYDESAVVEPILNGEVDIPPSPEQPSSPKITNDPSEENNLDNNSSLLDNVMDFESQLSQKMLELMERPNSPDDETASLSSYDDIDWRDIKVGECVIVEPKKRIKKNDVEVNIDPNDRFKCNHCISNRTPLCFICKSIKSPISDSEIRQRCNVIRCHQYYHLECLKEWPQTKYTTGSNQTKLEIMSCPRHVCHNCVSDDPQGCKTRFSGDKLARCVRCPATYHSFTQCTPAGTRLITASQIVCPRHCEDKSAKTSCHVNTAWCFICAKGGTLVCCETCPTSFHAECLNVPLPEGGYICEDCETGRLPLYEELVWVKLGQYRWWPALILHPSDIPPNIIALPHTPGQFAVRFFGIYDHYWVNSGRVFPYQEGDTGHASSKKSSVDNAFLTAVKQAQEAYIIIKELKEKGSHNELKSSLLPPKYVKLKVNRAIGSAVINSKAGESSKCDCNPDAEYPCSPDSDCLNRMLLTECSPSVCAAGTRCCNQYFEKRLYPALQPSRTSERGWGLRILEDVKKGDFLIEYVGEVIDEAEFQRRMTKRQEMRDENYYFLTLDKDRMIDAGPKGNFARFMNHSCEPNCETQKWTVNGDTRVGLFALKDIPGGTELTFNYNLVCAGDDKKKCLCGTKRCAGYIGAKPKQDESLPKKQKRVKLKRKYRKRVQNNQNASTSKSPRPRGRPSGSRLNNPDIQGIDRDVELINESLLEYYADGRDSKEEKLEEAVFKSEINYDEPIVFDADETKNDSKLSSGKKKVKKYRGIKRKRISKVNFRTKSIKISTISSDNSSPDSIHNETETDDNEKSKIVKVEAEDLEQISKPSETEVKTENEPKEELTN